MRRTVLVGLAISALLLSCAPRQPVPKVASPKGPAVAQPSPWDRDTSRPPRVLLFRATGFPTIDAPPLSDETLDAALGGLDVRKAATPAELTQHLWLREVDVLVLPYGSAFPVDSWPQIQAFLKHGGGLVVLGGAPLHEPVRLEHAQWKRGPRQTVFAHDLLIGPAEPVPLQGGTMKSLGVEMPVGKTTWALTLRLTTDKDFPDEHGSAGPRVATATPLAHVLDAGGTPRGCPAIEIDHVRGPMTGGRYVLATTDAALDANVVRALVLRALKGPVNFRLAPKIASSASGTAPELTVSLDAPARNISVVVNDDAGRKVFEGKIETAESGFATTIKIDTVLPPGIYFATATHADQTAKTAFWIRDDALLKNGPSISVSQDWLRKNERPFPIVGTTYMASDVHRHFLFEPNPAVWDADFADMERRGIRFVRTGLWTAWSRVMPSPGQVDAGVLAALEAFVQTAARHGIVVCFNLFAFLPPAYGGTNPYLDPRSIAGQKELLSTFAARFRDSPWIHWDLINEPSYSPLAKLWRTRPIGDAHEATAWKQWVHAQHQRSGEGEGKLRALWRTTEPDVFAVPREEDFQQVAVQIDKRPRKTRDFREFVEDAVERWAFSMRASIREASPKTLVTLGQDEGGIYERPTQQLMARGLDYTAVHTWWKNDDLLWDGVVTKVIGKPNLHQETGLMRLEDLDGTPWRSPDDAAALLERKVAYAFAARGAGVVEWVWNVNPLMPLDEEATIGLFRPDGTAKPELDVLQRYAAFFEKAAPHLEDFEPDPVVLVVPHARAFLGMTGTVDASKQTVRVLAERFGVVPAAVSDLRIGDRLRRAKLVIVPSPDVLDEDAAKALLEASKAGTKILITGSVGGDSYGQKTPSLEALGVLGPSRPVAMHEKSAWGSVAFEGLLQETARRADKPSKELVGGENVWHEPLPLELARDREPLVRLLRAALTKSKVAMSPADDGGVAGRVLIGPKSALLVAVNERAEPAKRTLVVDGHSIELQVPARGARMRLVQRATGRTIVE